MLNIQKITRIIQDHQPIVAGNPRKAAILLLLTQVDGEWNILFEVRGKTIRQPGETSFPGGGIEPDETALNAALRETEEELNIPSEFIRILGEIDYTVSELHYVRCFVGILHDYPIAEIKVNKSEVEDIYTVPLAYFMEHDPTFFDTPLQADPSKNFPFELIPNGINYPFYALKRKIPFYSLPKNNKYVLWGYTASFVHNFVEILKKSDAT